MKKNAGVRVNVSSGNSKKNKLVKSAGKSAGRAHPQAQPRNSIVDEPLFAQAVQNYEAGLKALQQHKFERAQGYLAKVVSGGPRELADRALMHLNTCTQQLSHGPTSFKTPAEHYDYAVSLLNDGDYDNARIHLDKIMKQAPQADFAWYGMALLECKVGGVEGVLRHLEQAIKLNAANRFQARNDSDFFKMQDDPRFTELLYPEYTAPAEHNSNIKAANPQKASE